MDEIAERGYAAHWKYKGVKHTRDVFEAWLDTVREMVDKANGDNSVSFINEFKASNLFAEEVFIYTPKGEMKVFPKGATALDFAFYIHTDVGYHCSAIKVNHKLVPMGYKLQNGDQVQVITNKNQKPSESWLKIVVTGKARDKIRNALKEEQKKVGEYGKEALQRKLDHMKADYEDAVDVLLKYFGFKTRLEFYCAIANDAVDLQDDLKRFKVEKGKLNQIEIELTPLEKTNPEFKSTPKEPSKPQLFINSESGDHFEYQMATCCNPVQGDDVFAYVSSNNITKIHRSTCPNATNMRALYGYRIMDAEWGASTNSSFIAELLITGIDEGPGVIERVSGKISNQLGLNIRSFTIEGVEGYFEGRIRVIVANKDQLAIAIKALKSLSGVSNVTRVE